MGTNTRIILGITCAAAAGVIIGVLIAPDKGSEMRKKVTKTASDFINDLSNMIMERKEQLTNAKDQIIQETKGLGEDAKARFSRVKESLSKEPLT